MNCININQSLRQPKYLQYNGYFNTLLNYKWYTTVTFMHQVSFDKWIILNSFKIILFSKRLKATYASYTWINQERLVYGGRQ